MNVFISWSGARSRAVAEALRQWIRDIFPTVSPFMSQQDIAAGARWNPEVTRQLSETKFGVLCITPENTEAPWLMFEAGALAKTVTNTWVCPYLIGIDEPDLPKGPLNQFQTKAANEAGTLELVRSLNETLKEGQRKDDELLRAFEKYWPDLDRALQESVGSREDAPPRDVGEKVDEILDIVRGLARRQSVENPGRMLREAAERYLESPAALSDPLDWREFAKRLQPLPWHTVIKALDEAALRRDLSSGSLEDDDDTEDD